MSSSRVCDNTSAVWRVCGRHHGVGVRTRRGVSCSERSIWIHFLINSVTSKCYGENRWPTGFPVPSSTTTRWLPPGYCYSIIILYWMSVLMLGLYRRGIIALSTKADFQNVFFFLCGGREIAGGKESITNWLLLLFLHNFDKRCKLLLLLWKQLVKWIFQNMGPIHFFHSYVLFILPQLFQPALDQCCRSATLNKFSRHRTTAVKTDQGCSCRTVSGTSDLLYLLIHSHHSVEFK